MEIIFSLGVVGGSKVRDFKGLRIERMQATSKALREGVLLELIGREKDAEVGDNENSEGAWGPSDVYSLDL